MQRSNAKSGEPFSQSAQYPNNPPASCPVSTMQSSPQRMRKRQSSFAFKLHEMLDEAEKLPCLKAIVSWQPHGRAFIVHNTFLFIQEANKQRFFKQTKYQSFQRQLNLYGFSRISSGIDKGAYYHELFLRGMPGLCHRIQRLRIKGTKVRKPASPANEPDFYSMPACLPSPSSRGGVSQQVGSYPSVACQTMPPKSSFSPSLASAFKRHDDTLAAPPVVSGGEGNGTKGYKAGVSLMMNCELANRFPDLQPLDYSHTLETDLLPLAQLLSQPLYCHGQVHHVKEVMRTAKHSTEQLKEASTLIPLDRNDSVPVRPLKGLGGQVLSTSETKLSSRTIDFTPFLRPCQLTREVTDYPDRARMRQLDNEQAFWAETTSKDETPVSENIPFVLHLEPPTRSGQPKTSQGITFVRMVDSNCKISQSQANPCIEIDGKVPSVSGLIDASDHPTVLPLTLLVSDDEENNEYNGIMGDHGLVINGSVSRASEHEDRMGLERLPGDAELEEFIAWHMIRMDHN